jgi:hypothetical protein
VGVRWPKSADQLDALAAGRSARMAFLSLILFLIFLHWEIQATLLITTTAIARPRIESIIMLKLLSPGLGFYPSAERQNVISITRLGRWREIVQPKHEAVLLAVKRGSSHRSVPSC